MTVRWTPKESSGWRCRNCMAWAAQGQGTIRLVERAKPSSKVVKMAALTDWHIPRSSALMIRRRAWGG